MGTIIMKIKETKCNQQINLAVLSALLLPLLVLLQPHNAVGAPISCSAGVSGCHFTPTVKDGTARNVPDGLFTGSHARHSGYSTSSTKRQYLYACTVCHPSSGYTNAHQSGFKNITGSGLAGASYTGGRKIANTNNPAFGSCNSNYCHSTGQSTTGGATPVYNPVAWGATATCGSCHLDFKTSGSATANHVKHAQTYSIACASCHNGYTETTVTTATHVNKTIETSFSGTLATGTTYSQANQTVGNGYGNCTTSYCHSSGQSSTGGVTPNYVSATWNGTAGCGSCHLNFDSNASATGDHVVHAQTNNIACAACHNGYTETTSAPATHVNKVVEVTFSGNATGTTYSQGNSAVGDGYGTCSTSYCHSTGQSTSGGSTPVYPGTPPTWGTGTMNCASCHKNMDSDATAPGNHVKHAQTYPISCATCHNGYTETTAPAGTTHVNKTIEVAFSGTLATGTTYSGGTTNGDHAAGGGYGTCSTSKCHSTGRSNINYATPAWGGGAGCLICHAGRASANGAQANSSLGFKLSTSHSQHLKYAAGSMNCQICHAKTATDAATLKNFTGVNYHVNGTNDVKFTNLAYASYTSYKTSGAKTGYCTNTSCHGGSTRSAWSNQGAINDNHTCTHCHGVGTGVSKTMSVTGANRYNLRYFAPGWNKSGTSTDQTASSANLRVGSHFKHLSSAYMKNIKCNECHSVPSTPIEASGNHTLNTLRFNSGTLTFVQASSARILIGVGPAATPSQLSTFSGYTNGTASKAATCSSTYCHGWRQKGGDTTGSYRKPYWNYSAMINYSDKANACGRCHGNPPRHGSYSTTHIGKAATVSCSTCHNHFDSSGNLKDKSKHIDGRVQASGGHAFPYPGATHSIATGATNPASNCNCHDYTGTGSYPVGAGTAPACKACHTVGLLRTVATSSCYDCHGSGAGTTLESDAMPNGGTTFANWSGAHPAHVTRGGMACSDCHANGGTGNTAHGHSNATAKTRTTVNVSGGFTYTAASQTCTNVTGCHGTAVWSVTQMDCVGCHGSVLNGVRAAANEIGTGTANKSHHVTSGTLTKWHCILCHAEGNYTTGGTTTLHSDGSINLRNVDSIGNPGTPSTNYWTIPRSGRVAADYTNVDNFCFKCHDSVGSAQIAINASGNLITSGLTATNQQKPFNDNLTNSYDAVARTRVVDVDTQFNTGNYSHHAVKAAKYTNTGGLPFNSVAILQGGNVDDNSRLHCHDCHVYNGHGTANNEYMLQNSSGTDTLHTLTTYVCAKCHTATYNTDNHYGGGNSGDLVNGRSGNYNVTGISCTACHNSGGMMWGGIHGGNFTYATGATPGWTTTGGNGGGAGSQSTYRFMPGMANNGYQVNSWTNAASPGTCYTNPNSSWSACSSHTGGRSTTVTRTGGARALSY